MKMFKFYHTPKVLRAFYPHTVFTLPNPNNEIVLTFDDGPNPEYTPRILEILDKYSLKAHFFFLKGTAIEKYPEIANQIKDCGHGIGNHFYNHNNMFLKPTRIILQEIYNCSLVIKEITGIETSFIRPPFGKINPFAIRSLVNHEYINVIWDVLPYDFEKPGVQNIVKNTLKYVTNGSIIALHDGGGNRSQTIEALPRIIESLQSKYKFVLLNCKNYDFI